MLNKRHGLAYKNIVWNRFKKGKTLTRFYVPLLEEKAKSDLKRIHKLYYFHILEDIELYCEWWFQGSDNNVC